MDAAVRMNLQQPQLLVLSGVGGEQITTAYVNMRSKVGSLGTAYESCQIPQYVLELVSSTDGLEVC